MYEYTVILGKVSTITQLGIIINDETLITENAFYTHVVH